MHTHSLITTAIAIALCAATPQQAEAQDSFSADMPAGAENTISNADGFQAGPDNPPTGGDGAPAADDITLRLSQWYAQQVADNPFIDPSIEADTIMPMELPDSVYIQRLQSLHSFIELPYNDIVKRYIYAYIHTKRPQVELMIGLGQFYLPIFESALDRAGLPIELSMLPVIESALNPNAISPVGATGLWQFMYSTGRMYKLTINSYVDDRRDPALATHAAISYLADLYGIFHDWTLAIAAYNCGPNNVNKAIRRSGGKRSYWDIYYYLPRETRGYVPAFIAATYAFNFYQQHGLTPKTGTLPIATDTVGVPRMLHLQQVSQVLDVPIDELRMLNPRYKQDIIPGEYGNYALRMPLHVVDKFIDHQQEIYNYNDTLYFTQQVVANPGKFTESSQYSIPAGAVKYKYKVKAGDVPGTIAERFGVSVRQLKEWNKIKRNIIRVNQQLTIYVSKAKAKKLGLRGA